MRFLQTLKNTAKRTFTAMCAVVLAVTSGIITSDMTTMTASAAPGGGTTYLSDALYASSGKKYKESQEDWQSYLDSYSKSGNTYYLGTPYSSWLHAASPNGDKWQLNEGYSTQITNNGGSTTKGGMNCTGFVWYAISHSLAHYSKQSIAVTGTWVPNADKFNSKGFSRSCWNGKSGDRWYDFIQQYNVKYYEFTSKKQMLNSGNLQKGDIIWCVDGSIGSGMDGLSQAASYHHIGIYMGDGSTDRWWQSGPVQGDGNTTGEINSINQIYGKAKKNTYVVIPWAEGYTQPDYEPEFIRVQKSDAETGKASSQGAASLAGAEFTFSYYADPQATGGTPDKKWVLKTDSNGLARLDKSHLVSGSPYVKSNGEYYLPLGTVIVQETKAPTGYQLNEKKTILRIEDHDQSGKATVRVAGTQTYLQEYTVKTDEQILRGNLKFTKLNGNDDNSKFANIPFVLTNNDTGESHIILTDSDGRFDASKNRNHANALDSVKSKVIPKNGEYTLDADAMASIAGTASGVWFGGGDVQTTGGALIYGNYTLQEIRCPANEGLHLIARQFQVNAATVQRDFGRIIDTPKVGTITGKKVNPNGSGLTGAVIGLFAEDAEEFTEENANMTTVSGDDGAFRFDNVPAGNYIVHEIQAPAGYMLSDKSYPVTVAQDGIIPMGEDLVNTPTKVTVEKTDADGKPLSGAKLQIIARLNVKVNNGTVVEEWTTDGTAQTISGKLEVGGYYELTEVTPPDGYVKASSVMFTIGADGKTYDTDGNPMDLKLVDAPTVVTVTKHNEDEELLAGAKMQILDSKGEVVDEWITGTEAHVITAKLAVGGTYTLHEAEAPAGYYPEDDMPFTVPESGSITVDMIDYATTSVIHKRDDQNRPVSGAVLQILAPDSKVVDEWTTDGTAHVVSGLLNPNTTYTLHEVSAPEGYFPAEDKTFQVNDKGELLTPILMIDVKYGSLLVGKMSDIQQQPDSGDVIWLAGAKLQILDQDGNVLDEWTSESSSQHVIEAILHPGETYVLHEVAAPDGYCTAADIEFTLDEKGQFAKSDSYESGQRWIRMYDLATKVEIQKLDEDSKALAGASLQLLDKAGKVVDSWVSDENVHQIYGRLLAGETYTLHEVAAPAGYCVAADKTFTVGTDGKVQNIELIDLSTKVSITKEDENGKALAGAQLELYDSNNVLVESWTSDGKAHEIQAKLTAGAAYTLHEAAAPAGYVVAKDMKFTVNADGSVTDVVMVDIATKVEITKTDITGEKELFGAKLEVRDLSGNVLDSWISTEKAHVITAKLSAGQTYVLHEESAPNGYVVANDVEFTVNTDATITKVEIKDDTTKVEFHKLTEDGKPLSGAKLQILAKDGTVVDEWTSDGTVHVLTAKLIAGAEYILHEVSAPAGYCVAADKPFTVGTDGKLQSVSMTDLSTKVSLTKYEITGKKELPGAKLELYAVEKDKDGKLVQTGKVIDAWTSTEKAHEIVGELIAGASYILHETAAPAGYVIASDVSFTVNADGSVTPVVMKDDTTKVEIHKLTEDGKPLSGAKLQILDSKGKVVDEWTSDGTVHVLRAKLTAGQTYTLREVASPAGYYVSKDSTFTVNLDGTPNEITLYNVRTKAAITKYDITGENPLAGASLQVLDQDGNVIDEWVSTAEAHLIEGVLISGETYILRETAAPAGYVVSDDVQFTVNPDGTITTVEMKDDTTKVSITKQDITGEKELAGAALEVRDADGNVIDSWVSDGTAHVITGILAAGETYTLHEVSAPDGYVVAKDAEFTVDASGKVTSVTMLDDTTKVSITKTNITGDAEIPGASMEVRDAQGNVIDAWISDGTAHPIIGVLAVGQTYTLHEVAAPAGYVVASDIEFTVNADGSVTEVSMKDDTTKVQLSKQAITGSAELPGASLELYDANGNVVDAWISGSTPHDIEGVLTAGAEYTLHEVSAPNGYVVASDVKFTVGLDGAVDQVTMVDDTTKVEISKTDITTGELLSGATLQIIASDNTVVEEWVSTAEPHMIEAVLTAGETYTLHETAAPNGYVISEDVSFTVNLDGSVTPVKMYDDVTKVRITKYDITGETELPGASLEVRDADGNVVDAWISTDSAHEINGVLIAGAEYTLHEISAPNGYVTATDVKFNVNADGSVTMVSMKDYPTVVHITKKDITTGEELPGAYLELYDKDHNLIDSWVSGTEAHIIEAVLIAGEKYTLIETSAPNGYVISEQIEFTVNLDETITHVDMFDDTTKVSLSKKSITGDDELPGASMQLLDKDGNIVDEWISGTEPHRIEGILIAGETYTLHEESAPNGYVVASDMEFTVSTDGKVDVITMTDDTTKVEISKTDITGEKPVEGAKLQIIDKDGNIVHEWISGKDVNYLEADLTAGETYVLHEESAPDGYVVSEDVEFTVNADGTIHQIQMKDATTKVSITKYDITTGEELPGATLQILDKDGNVIDEWVSTAEAHLIEGVLIAGETYTLREITAPDGWTVTEDVNFTVDTDGSVTHVEMFDSPTNVSIRKLGADGKDLAGAKMQILDKDGNVIEEWTTDGKAHVLTAKLVAGETYTLHEVSAPDGYTVAKDKMFTVGEEDAVTEVVMVDEKVPVATPTPSTTSAPKTADAMPVMAIGTGLLASLILMLFFRKKKRSKK